MASQAQLTKEIALIDALLEDILQRRVVRGQFNGREYTLHNATELVALRGTLEAQLQDVTAGGRQSRQIVPRG